ncbi:MAG: lysophospholipid acyltransferase family protein [Hyphomicrobiaceae bacterium]
MTDIKINENGVEPAEWPGQSPETGAIRAIAVLAGFMVLTLPLMPVQWIFLKTSRWAAQTFPHWYHRRVCGLLGVRLHVQGKVKSGRPTLLISNHVSWLDIPVLSAVAPVSFVAKSEVGSWPFVSWLAKLQRTVFVDRTRRSAVGHVTDTMRSRLNSGDTLVLFAEGTSTDGFRVLPFKSALLSPAFAAPRVDPTRKSGSDAGADADAYTASKPETAARWEPRSHSEAEIVVQTLSLAYTHVHGIPIGLSERSLIGWYGDMEMGSHAWSLLKAGPIDAKILISDPVPLDHFANRKVLANGAQRKVEDGVKALLRGRPLQPPPRIQTSKT